MIFIVQSKMVLFRCSFDLDNKGQRKLVLGKAFGNRALVLTHLVWEQHFTWRSEQVPNGILSSVDIL